MRKASDETGRRGAKLYVTISRRYLLDRSSSRIPAAVAPRGLLERNAGSNGVYKPRPRNMFSDRPLKRTVGRECAAYQHRDRRTRHCGVRRINGMILQYGKRLTVDIVNAAEGEESRHQQPHTTSH